MQSHPGRSKVRPHGHAPQLHAMCVRGSSLLFVGKLKITQLRGDIYLAGLGIHVATGPLQPWGPVVDLRVVYSYVMVVQSSGNDTFHATRMEHVPTEVISRAHQMDPKHCNVTQGMSDVIETRRQRSAAMQHPDVSKPIKSAKSNRQRPSTPFPPMAAAVSSESEASSPSSMNEQIEIFTMVMLEGMKVQLERQSRMLTERLTELDRSIVAAVSQE